MADYASNAFMYNGTRYVLQVVMHTFDNIEDSCALDILSLDRFEYTNQLNDLLLHGHIVYVDKYGILDKFLDEQFVFCEVSFAKSNEKYDGPVSIQRLSQTSHLEHTFFVEGMQILSREKSIVTYQIDIVSSNVLNCSSNIVYSNYDIGPQPVLDVLKNCMTIGGLQIDMQSFESVKSSVELQYITNGNDTLETVVPYLFRRLYYLEQRDDSLKFLAFNEHSGKYQLFDMKKTATSTGDYSIVVSFFKTSAEHMAQQEPVNFGVVTKTSKMQMTRSLFNTDMFSFDYDSNQISQHLFSDQENVSYFGNRFDSFGLSPKVRPMAIIPGCDFRHRSSAWNNDVDFYHDYQQALAETNALVVNAVGELLRKPGSTVSICVDRSPKELNGEDPVELERLKTSYRAFEGPWVASKVRHIIEPNKGPEGNGSYRQNLVLMRNFQISDSVANFSQQVIG